MAREVKLPPQYQLPGARKGFRVPPRWAVEQALDDLLPDASELEIQQRAWEITFSVMGNAEAWDGSERWLG